MRFANTPVADSRFERIYRQHYLPPTQAATEYGAKVAKYLEIAVMRARSAEQRRVNILAAAAYARAAWREAQHVVEWERVNEELRDPWARARMEGRP